MEDLVARSRELGEKLLDLLRNVLWRDPGGGRGEGERPPRGSGSSGSGFRPAAEGKRRSGRPPWLSRRGSWFYRQELAGTCWSFLPLW